MLSSLKLFIKHTHQPRNKDLRVGDTGNKGVITVTRIFPTKESRNDNSCRKTRIWGSWLPRFQVLTSPGQNCGIKMVFLTKIQGVLVTLTSPQRSGLPSPSKYSTGMPVALKTFYRYAALIALGNLNKITKHSKNYKIQILELERNLLNLGLDIRE